mgnify:CR=1 FL=1
MRDFKFFKENNILSAEEYYRARDREAEAYQLTTDRINNRLNIISAQLQEMTNVVEESNNNFYKKKKRNWVVSQNLTSFKDFTLLPFFI